MALSEENEDRSYASAGRKSDKRKKGLAGGD